MNRQSELFDNRIADWLEDDPVHAPAQLLETVLAAMPSVPQRRAGQAWRPAALPRWWQLAAAAALVVALGFLGLKALTPPTVAPSQSPAQSATPSVTTITPAPSSSPVAPSATTPGPPVSQLPVGMLGSWYHTAPAFMTFYPAGDPYCTDTVRTQFDCALWHPVGQAKENAIATLDGNVLSMAWKSGFCIGVTSTYTMKLSGDSLVLTEGPEGCQGGSYSLVRAGTNGTPTSPPE